MRTNCKNRTRLSNHALNFLIIYITMIVEKLGKGREYMSRLSNTQFFQVGNGTQIQAKDILEIVYQALREKGYDPVSQIVGYIMSGDPTYITSHNGARSLIMKLERDELVEEMLKSYIEHHSWE